MDLPNSLAIEKNLWHCFCQVELDASIRKPVIVADDACNLLKDKVYVSFCILRGVRAGKTKKIRKYVLQPQGLLSYSAIELAILFIFPPIEEIEAGRNSAQRIPDLVGHTGRHLLQHLLIPLSLGNIAVKSNLNPVAAISNAV